MGRLEKIRQQGLVHSLANAFNRLVPERLFRYGHMVFLVMDPDSFPGQEAYF